MIPWIVLGIFTVLFLALWGRSQIDNAMLRKRIQALEKPKPTLKHTDFPEDAFVVPVKLVVIDGQMPGTLVHAETDQRIGFSGPEATQVHQTIQNGRPFVGVVLDNIDVENRKLETAYANA